MRYVVRCDANPKIGAGHVMRTSAIAEELIDLGLQVEFIGQIEDLPWLSKRISELGFSAIYSEENEILGETMQDVLILDSYEIPISNPFIARNRWKRVISISDSMSPDYECDLVVYQSFSKPKKLRPNQKMVFGTDYFVIRKSLHVFAKERKFISSSSPMISIVGGGTDLNNFTQTITNILQKSNILFQAKVFTNNLVKKELDNRFEYLPVGQDLDRSFIDCELAVTSASTTAIEFIACGIPTAIAALINNQDENYLNLSQLGIALPVGSRNEQNQLTINEEKLLEITSSITLRKQLHTACSNTISFGGAKRIVEKIQSL